jgi:type VI secretion system protein ImpJ
MLATEDPYWRGVTSEKTVAIYLPPPFDPSQATITLMGIPERRTRG